MNKGEENRTDFAVELKLSMEIGLLLVGQGCALAFGLLLVILKSCGEIRRFFK